MYLPTLAAILVLFMFDGFAGAVNNIKGDDVTHFNVTEGRDLEVTCETSTLFVEWIDKTNAVVSTGKLLSFYKIKRKQAGTFKCVTLINRELKETINVNVQYPAKLHIDSNTNNPIHENDTASFLIQVDGNPPPYTTFTLEDNGGEVHNETGTGNFTFTVKHVSCNDGGQYKFVSTNSIGDDTKTEEIRVYCPPSTRLPSHDMFQPRLGANLDINVATLGYPYPNFTWTFKGKALPCKTKHFESDLELKNFKVDEFGSYMLMMENDLGQFNHTFSVMADGPPGQIMDLTVNNITASIANITWTSGYDYGAKQNFIIKSYNGSDYEVLANFPEMNGSHGLKPVSHVIKDLEAGMTYNLSVVANNSRGHGEMSTNSVMFTAVTPTSYPVTEHDGIFIECNGTSPGANVYWVNADRTFRHEGPQLSVFNTTRNYTGIYMCMENVNTTIITLETIFVDVQYPAKILQLKAPSKDVNVNDSYTILLTLEGNPLPATSLSQSGDVSVEVNMTGTFNVSIDHVVCTDDQSVKITSMNKIGNDTETEELHVHCSPSPKRGIHNKFQPRLDDTTILQVENVGYPYPNYTWMFNGKVLANETTGGDKDDYIIKGVTIDDFGIYTVKMSNNLGLATYNYSVEAYGPPDPVTKLSVNNITTNSVNITFVSGYNYGAKQNFVIESFEDETYHEIARFEDKSKISKPANVSHVVSGLKYGTIYNLTVVSNNSRGESERSAAFVLFTTQVPYRVVDILEGDNLTLTCNGTNMTDVHWENNSTKKLSSGEVLKLYGISRNDTGFLKCVGKSDIATRHIIEDVFLDVQYSAKILNMSVNHDSLHPNDTFMMELTVEGNPSPNITFIKIRNGKEVFFTNTTGIVNVTIDPVKCTDLGQYQLVVSNQIASQSEKQDIYVYCPPVVDPDVQIQTKFYPRLGKETQIKIENYGYPYPNYTWTHNKAPIIKHKDTDIGSSIDVTVTLDDFGSFDVDMVNEEGNVDVSFQLIAEGPPDPVTDMKVDNFTYNSVTLSWTSGFNYNSPQTFKLMKEYENKTFIEFKDFPDKSAQGLEKGDYVVTGLDSSSVYKFSVVSLNKNGTSDMAKETVQFTTADAPSHHKSNKKAVIGGVIGALCGLAIIIAVAVFMKRRRDRKKNAYQPFGERYD